MHPKRLPFVPVLGAVLTLVVFGIAVVTYGGFHRHQEALSQYLQSPGSRSVSVGSGRYILYGQRTWGDAPLPPGVTVSQDGMVLPLIPDAHENPDGDADRKYSSIASLEVPHPGTVQVVADERIGDLVIERPATSALAGLGQTATILAAVAAILAIGALIAHRRRARSPQPGADDREALPS